MLSNDIKKRYRSKTYGELCFRVSAAIDPDNRNALCQMMLRRQFLPAGNTLLAGTTGFNSDDNIRLHPNCCILGMLSDERFETMVSRAERLWAAAIGVGWRFDETKDPATALRIVSEHNAAIHLDYRPQRGDIGIIDIEHLQMREFVLAKNESVYNMNISVAASNAFMDKACSKDPDARDRLRFCAERAHETGDPGVVFFDRFPVGPLGPINALVPCGEQGMYTNEACNLGSINLAAIETPEELRVIVRRAVRILDDVVDMLYIPDPEVAEMTRQMRRIGLGLTGFAQALRQRNIDYGSPEAMDYIHTMGQAFADEASLAEEEITAERGVSACSKRRNVTVTCIAPTGGITKLFGHESYAIEPFFSESHSGEISTEAHIVTLATWQKYVENSIAKTVNMPAAATADDVFDVYLSAYKAGCRSITIYRDGSRTNQPITSAKECRSGLCS